MAFDFQPILRGELVELLPLQADDFAELFAVAADPLIWGPDPAKVRYQPGPFRAFFEESLQSGGSLVARDWRTHAALESQRDGRTELARSLRKPAVRRSKSFSPEAAIW